MALLELRDLHTFFKTKKGIVKAVNGVSYQVESGRTLGIVGESGSGKSVSAMSILQLLDGNGYIDSGEILFEGQDLTKCTKEEMYKIRGNKISVIFQEPMTSLNPVFTVERQLNEVFLTHQKLKRKEPRTGFEAVSAPAFRRHAPARHDRHGAGLPSAGADCGRAHYRSGCDHSGPDSEADERPEGRKRHLHPLYHP